MKRPLNLSRLLLVYTTILPNNAAQHLYTIVVSRSEMFLWELIVEFPTFNLGRYNQALTDFLT